MAEKGTSFGISDAEITALKEALFAQQELLQKLYNELDVERESASTAASEALSMILRLQGEKASVKMEANQYRRLAEEKMCHAEESLAIFEELIYQKEMEIASLEYQVEAYRYKLLSLGCTDISVCETKFPENLLHRNENFAGEMGFEKNLRRNSMPPIPYKFSYQKKGIVEREKSTSPDLISKIAEENRNSELSTQILETEMKLENVPVGDVNSYWEQIRKLDERVKEISDYKGIKSKKFTLGPTKGDGNSSKYGQIEHPQCSSHPFGSSSVHDVFEVPRIPESEKGYEVGKEQNKLIMESNMRPGNVDSFMQVAFKPYGEDGNCLVKKMFPTKHHKKTFGGEMESHPKIQQLNKTSEIVEVERHGDKPVRGEEELKLLKEIREQLNTIQSEIRTMKIKKSSPSYEFSVLSLTEAMLHFWL